MSTNTVMDPSLLSPPLSASTVGSRRNKYFKPLSAHGMPKDPPPLSPGSIRSDRFGNVHSPRSSRSTSITSPPMTPMSFMSPPLSARSFGTFIESTPSTPSFSPLPPSSQWDGPTLVLLSPVPSSNTSSPPEPEWEMMMPEMKTNQPLKKVSSSSGLGISIAPTTSLSSHPPKPHHEKENLPPEDATPDAEPGRKADEAATTQADTLDKIKTRVKSILRRKPEKDKKSSGRRQRRSREEFEYVRAETLHWTDL